MTQGYLNKFDIFKNNFENSISYIRNSLFLYYLNEYKNLIIKFKKLLQTIKNTKISNIYPDFNDLKFTDENIEKIDLLYIRLNKYFSDNIFNQNYISHINYFKEQKLNELDEEVKNYIEEANNNITYSETISDIINDFYYSFKTKAFYTCTNGLLSYYVNSNDNYCLHLINSQNSENIKDISIYKVEDIKYFISEFNKFYSSIEEIVNLYD